MSSATFDCQWRRIDTERHAMTRHLVADLSFLVLRPGVAQRQGSQAPLSYLQHYTTASFLFYFFHLHFLHACLLLLCPFEMLPWLRPTGRSGSTTLASSHITLIGRRSDDMARLDAFFRICASF